MPRAIKLSVVAKKGKLHIEGSVRIPNGDCQVYLQKGTDENKIDVIVLTTGNPSPHNSIKRRVELVIDDVGQPVLQLLSYRNGNGCGSEFLRITR